MPSTRQGAMLPTRMTSGEEWRQPSRRNEVWSHSRTYSLCIVRISADSKGRRVARIEQDVQDATVTQDPSRYPTPGLRSMLPCDQEIRIRHLHQNIDRFLAGEPDFDPKIGS